MLITISNRKSISCSINSNRLTQTKKQIAKLEGLFMNTIIKIVEIRNVLSTSKRHMTPRRERCAAFKK